jgi:hypothetical protein
MCAEVSIQTHLLADGRDELPGLSSLYGFSIGVGFGVEKYIILWIIINTRISFQELCESLLNTIINHNFLALTPFCLFDPKSSFGSTTFIYKMTNTQLQQVRYP